ncbi:MAG: type II toxin-antitoxin system VapC family toxin [Gemmatimonadaceae bacterium]
MIVTDASVILELLLRTSAAEAIEARVLDAGETLHAPHLLDVEVAQVLRRYAARGEISAARGRLTLGLLARLPIARYAHEPLLPRVWALRANMTAYDAAYVALAEALGATLLTRDERLASAPGTRAKIELAGA